MTTPRRCSLFNLVQPRDEVLHTSLDESIFAANLTEALKGTAPAVYSDPQQFFLRTHPTAGLQDLLRMALGRLTGVTADESPVIRVDTNLGGGKTHNLIALVHACRFGIPAANVASLLGEHGHKWLEATGKIRIGTFVGSDHGVSAAESTPWGALARDIGGTSGYALVRADDEGRSAPGAVQLKTLLQSHPTLIVIDEIAHYLDKALAVKVGGSTLADQVLTFIMSLCEAAAQCRHTVVVLTTTQESQVFTNSTEEVIRRMAGLVEITGRQAHLIQPAAEVDVPGVLACRLFANVDRTEVPAITQAYADVLERAEDIIGGLPQEMLAQRMAQRMQETWPYHPELVALLDKRLSTNPRFQRTRGALRLLARTVQLLWQRTQADGNPLAIHSHHLDLADNDIIRPQLTSALLRPQLDQVARADIASQPGTARAQLIDEAGGRAYARRSGTVCFLESLTLTAGAPTQGAILGAALEPGDDPNQMLAAWEKLGASAWYLHQESGGYRFKTEPSLVRMIQERTDQVRNSEALQASVSLVEDMFGRRPTASRGTVFRVRRMYLNEKPTDNVEDVNLCLYSWAQFPSQRGLEDVQAPPEAVQTQWRQTDAGGLRRFRNRIVFVAPAATYYDAMLQVVKTRIALDDLAASQSLTRSLSTEARATLIQKRDKQQLDARVAVANVMSLLWYPESNDRLRLIRMAPANTARAERNQLDVVYDELNVNHKWMAAGQAPVDPALLRQTLGERLQQGCTVAEVEEFMAANGSSRILLDVSLLRQMIQNGIRNKEWDYRQADGTWVTGTQGDINSLRAEAGDRLYVAGTAPPPKSPLPIIKPPKPDKRQYIFKADASPDTLLNSLVQQALQEKHTDISCFEMRWGAEEKAAHTCLTKTFNLMGVLRYHQQVTMHVNLYTGTRIQGRNTSMQFTGSEEMAQACEEPAKKLLRTGSQSVFEATVTLEFEPSVKLEAPWQSQIADVMRNTNVSACQGTLTVPRPKGEPS